MSITWSDGTWYSIWEFAPNGSTNPWQREGPGTGYAKIQKYSGSSGDWVWATDVQGDDPKWIGYWQDGEYGYSATWSGKWNYFDWVKNITEGGGWTGYTWVDYYWPTAGSSSEYTYWDDEKVDAAGYWGQMSGEWTVGPTYKTWPPKASTHSITSGSGSFTCKVMSRGSQVTSKTATYTTTKTWGFKGWWWQTSNSPPSSYTAGKDFNANTYQETYEYLWMFPVFNDPTESRTPSGNSITFSNPSSYTAAATAWTLKLNNNGTVTNESVSRTTTYNFSKWTNAAGTQVTSPYTFTSDDTVTAQFTAGTTSTGAVKLPTPTRTNYTFGGWYTNSNFTGTKYNGGANYTPSANNSTLYAKWTINTVKLTLTKGTGISGVTIDGASATSKNINPGTSVTINATLNTGYHWKNWTSGTSTTQVSNKQSYTFNMPTSATTYKANGEANTYTVAYNANDGTGTTASSSHTYGVAKALTANGFTKFGHTFKGWAKTLDRAKAGTVDYNDKASVSNLTTSNGTTVTLYAVWEKYTKTYIYTNKKDGTSKWVPVEKYTYTSG